MADHRVGRVNAPNLGLGTVVSASSAFPPVLSPSAIAVDPAHCTRLDGADPFDDPRHTHTLTLGDGGLYDSLSLEPIDMYETVLVSDAGAPFGLQEVAKTDPIGQLSRALDMATDL